MNHKIKNLLFDLGGVIMDIERRRCVEAFYKLGLEHSSSFFGDYGQLGPFKDLERGTISNDEFHAIIRGYLPQGISDSQIDDAFNEFLVGIPEHRLRALEKLREDYNICLLSNTNAIMWDSKIREEFEKLGQTADYYFPGGLITSFEAKALKPEAEIFQYTIEHLGIKPEETLFFDDSEANLQAAAKLGFHTALVSPGAEFVDLIAQLSPNN